MMRLLTILICVFFLNGCFLNSVDCDAVADSVLYEEGISHLNDKEKEIRRVVFNWIRMKETKERWKLVRVCENNIKYGWTE